MDGFVQPASHSIGSRKPMREPTMFLHHLASQHELLACLRWFGEFQILACVPLTGRVPIRDVADLSGVPENQLARTIRFTTTVGFLQEPVPGLVGHTTLSAPFVTNPAFLDAAMFLAESAAPAALAMVPATQRHGDSDRPNESAYNVALDTLRPFHATRQERPKLHRQWSAYLQHAGGLHASEDLAQLDWNWESVSTGSSLVVEVGAQSTLNACRLAALHPSLHFLVQLSDQTAVPPRDLEGAPYITISTRTQGARQTVTDAAIYILHLPSASAALASATGPPSSVLAAADPAAPAGGLAAAIRSELHVHLGVLHASRGVMLIPTGRLLPEPGSVADGEAEATARARDLALRQLTNAGEMELAELLAMIDTVRDSVGRLVVTERLRARNRLVVALIVKHQLIAEGGRLLPAV